MPRLPFFCAACFLLASCSEVVEEEADEKFALAESALEAGKWAAADESFHETILLDPERAEAWIGRGMTLTQLGETDSARRHYEEALLLYQENSTPAEEDLGPIRHQIMLLVLLDRANEARTLASDTAAKYPDEKIAQELPDLIAKMQSQFHDMILPANSKENVPLLEEEQTADL